jgi:predicted nuclease of predicted toxin-antitoxin system
MKILIDMNLSPQWCVVLIKHGWEARHWSAVGDPRAQDAVIMEWALSNGYVVFTHDLDFGTILATTQANGPSVIQVRGQDIFPAHLETAIVNALHQFEELLEAGALIVVDEARARARMLPLKINRQSDS